MPTFAPQNIDAIMFDLDGTLWSTVPLCTRAWNSVLEKRQLPKRLTDHDVAGSMGLTAEKVRELFYPDLAPEVGRAIVDESFVAEMEFLWREGGVLYEGVEAGLAQLARRCPLALVSNCEVPYLEAFVKMTGLGKFFSETQCHGATRKTKGENVRDLVAKMGVRHPIYIGDTAGDEEAARVAGTAFGFAAYGFGKAARWDRRFENFSEIVELFR